MCDIDLGGRGMRLFINGEYKEVGFWSFLKCNILTSLVAGILWLLFWFVVFFIIGVTIA